MDKMIEKFMNSFGITYKTTQSDMFFVKGLRHVCIHVMAYREGKIELNIHYCYERKSNGEVDFDEGNIIMGPKNGVFSYLGNHTEVYKYFERKAEKIDKEYFSEENF
jgi:hypothetical protein